MLRVDGSVSGVETRATAFWSAKGGMGTTVCAAATAVAMGQRFGGVTLIDLAGDAPAVLGVTEPDGPGIIDWLSSDDEVPIESLVRLRRPVAPGLDLIHRGRAVEPRVARVDQLLDRIDAFGGPVVIDAGVIAPSSFHDTLSVAMRTLVEEIADAVLVIRPCYIAVRRVLATKVKAHAIVFVDEHGRSLGRTDVTDVLGAPVVATVDLDPAVARAVDAGLLAARLPADLRRVLSDVG